MGNAPLAGENQTTQAAAKKDKRPAMLIDTNEPARDKNQDLIELRVQNLMLFDKPKIKQPAESDNPPAANANNTNAHQ